MQSNIPKIKFTIEGNQLQVLRAISAEFETCGKVSDILLSAYAEKKNLKLNDSDFICVYKGILKALSSNRCPNKNGNEYNTIKELKYLFEQLHLDQRYNEIRL